MIDREAARRVADLGACLITITLLAQMGSGSSGPARQLMAVVFFLVVPGWAIVSHLEIDDLAVLATLVIVASLIVGTAASMTIVAFDRLTPSMVTVALAGGSACGIAARLRSTRGWPAYEKRSD